MVVFDILYYKKNSEEIISKEAKFFYENCSISVHTLFGLEKLLMRFNFSQDL